MTLRRIDLDRVAMIAAGATLAVAAATSVFVGPVSGLSVVVGGGFMLANFSLIRMLVSRLIAPQGNPATAAILLTGKLLIALALLAGVFYQVPIDPMAFAAGATLLLVAAVVEAAFTGDPLGPYVEPQEHEPTAIEKHDRDSSEPDHENREKEES